MTEHYDFGNDWKVRGHLKATKQAENPGDAPVLGADGMIPSKFINNAGWVYGLHFDPATFKTDPEGCLAYTQDCSSHQPVKTSNPDTTDVGDWIKDDPFFEDCYYCTMNGDGDILHELDPDDLSKSVNGVDCSTEIAANNVMFVIPKRFVKRNANSIIHSSMNNKGSALAHTRGTHVYNNLAIGVYPGTIVDGKLMSVSGVKATSSIAGATFRADAIANNSELEWHVWNWHEYQLYKDMVLFATKDFNVQAALGKGQCNAGNNAGVWQNNGVLNAAGMFAGDISATNKPVKAILENVWGQLWQLVDDCVLPAYRTDSTDPENPLYFQDFYAGANDNANITDDTTKKELIASIPIPSNRLSSGGWVYSKTIDTSDAGWGLPADMEGGDSVGLCDGHYMHGGALHAIRVGGYSNSGLGGGVSALALNSALSRSNWDCGARLAFSFD